MSEWRKDRLMQEWIDVTDDDKWSWGWCRICGKILPEFDENDGLHLGGAPKEINCRNCKLYYQTEHPNKRGPLAHIEVNRYGFVVIAEINLDFKGTWGHTMLMEELTTIAIREAKIIHQKRSEFMGFWTVLNAKRGCRTTLTALIDWCEEADLMINRFALVGIMKDMDRSIGPFVPGMFQNKKS